MPTTRNITLREYPHCCAMNILQGFNYDFPENTKLTGEQTEALQRAVKDKAQQASHLGMCILAINSNQYKQGLGKIVEDNGFKLLHRPFYYPGHGRHIYLYGLENFPQDALEMPGEVKPVKKVLKKRVGKSLFSRGLRKTPIRPLVRVSR